MRLLIKNFFILFVFLLWFIPTISFTANVTISSTDDTFATGEEFLVSVFLETGGMSLNAIEGKILFPSNLLEVKEIKKGNSSVNFWIEEPNISKPETIDFSGITPGGFGGEKAFLFSFVVYPKKDGRGLIKSDMLRVLQNDGKGTEIKVTNSDFKFTFSKQVSNSKLETPNDLELPEDFKPSLGSNPDLFFGKFFLAFVTQDKISGIDHYEIREGFWDEYVMAESPYLLKNQSLKKRIYIKAIDKNGNERVVTFDTEESKEKYQYFLIISIIFVLIIGLFISKKLW